MTPTQPSQFNVFLPGFRSATVKADGPWEALFRFCGKTGIHPSAVQVDPSIRVPDGEYQCSIGECPSFWTEEGQLP